MKITEKQDRQDRYFMDHAKLAAGMSYCERNKVGAVLVKDQRVICEGRNGTLVGDCNNCEDENNNTKNTVMHAEANAITFAARHGISTNSCSMYITLSPCIECAKLMIQSGITEVIYDDLYRNTDGIEFLKKYITVREIKK